MCSNANVASEYSPLEARFTAHLFCCKAKAKKALFLYKQS